MTVFDVVILCLVEFGVKLLLLRFQFFLFGRVICFLQLLLCDSELVSQGGHNL